MRAIMMTHAMQLMSLIIRKPMTYRSSYRITAATLAMASAAMLAGCTSSSSTAAGTGTLAVQLTDAPFSGDSVSRVDVFVVRVDTRLADADSATAAKGATDDSASTGGWTTVATPNVSVNLLSYQNGASLPMGQSKLAAGSYLAFRLIIDPTKSSVTLKNGAVLTGVSTPNVSFPSASRSGIKINLTTPVIVKVDQTTIVLIDFLVNDSFVMRGNTIAQNGLLFKPVIRASVR